MQKGREKTGPIGETRERGDNGKHPDLIGEKYRMDHSSRCERNVTQMVWVGSQNACDLGQPKIVD